MNIIIRPTELKLWLFYLMLSRKQLKPRSNLCIMIDCGACPDLSVLGVCLWDYSMVPLTNASLHSLEGQGQVRWVSGVCSNLCIVSTPLSLCSVCMYCINPPLSVVQPCVLYQPPSLSIQCACIVPTPSLSVVCLAVLTYPSTTSAQLCLLAQTLL